MNIHRAYNVAIPLVCLIFLLFFLLYPIFSLFSGAAIERAYFTLPSIRRAGAHSLLTTTVTSVLAVSSAYIYAFFLNTRLHKKSRAVFAFIAIVPMLIPSIAHGNVLTYLLGNKGVLTPLMYSGFDIYGFKGIVLGSFGYTFPAAFLILNLAFSTLDQRQFYAGDTIGMNNLHKLRYIIMPHTKYAAFSAFTVAFTMAFTDYGVPIAIGGTYSVLPSLLYQQVIGLQNMNIGAIIAFMLIIPALITFVLDNTLFASKTETAARQSRLELNPVKSNYAEKASFIMITVLILLPIVFICFIPFMNQWPYDQTPTFKHIIRAFTVNNLLDITVNSILISLGAAVFGTVVVFFGAYYTVRMPNTGRRTVAVMNLLFTLSLAIPGLVLGLAYLSVFGRSLFAGTFAILIVVNIIHFIGSPFLIMKNCFKELSPDLEYTYISLGGTLLGAVFRIIAPMSERSIIESFVYLFVNTMVTISAVAFLFTYNTKTLALQITSFDETSDIEGAMTVALIILLINMVFKLSQKFVFSKKK